MFYFPFLLVGSRIYGAGVAFHPSKWSRFMQSFSSQKACIERTEIAGKLPFRVSNGGAEGKTLFLLTIFRSGH